MSAETAGQSPGPMDVSASLQNSGVPPQHSEISSTAGSRQVTEDSLATVSTSNSQPKSSQVFQRSFEGRSKVSGDDTHKGDVTVEKSRPSEQGVFATPCPNRW